MVSKAYCAAVTGLDATIVTAEVCTTYAPEGMPCATRLTGLPDAAVRESRDRIYAALINSGFNYPSGQNVTVSLSPADLRKEGSGYDLPIAIATLAASDVISPDRLVGKIIIGELGLDGSLLPVRGVLPIAIKAKKEGFKAIIVPRANAQEAAVVEGIDTYGLDSLIEATQLIRGDISPEPVRARSAEEMLCGQAAPADDFADVRGQESVKRALEVAAAGGHNLIMIGPPGSGKSMMAKRLPGILPPLTPAESLETTQVHSVAGKLPRGASLITQRPFRAPHHTISQIALTGGGANPQPGEISLAHNGVLFCDELPEFNRSALEVLRQPLEDRHITISRANYTAQYPCSFMFIASMNPCPCGYYGDPTHKCVCSPGQIQRYMNRISGPLLDRIDIQCEITPVPFKDISQAAPGESSADIRRRVIAARAIQARRFHDVPGIHCNAQMTDRLIHQYAEPDADSLEMLRLAMDRLSLSARAYSRILKVARTIADLETAQQFIADGLKPEALPATDSPVTAAHLAEAVSYRTLDRGDWAERNDYQSSRFYAR